MKIHDYAYDVNRILSLSTEQNNYQVEGFVLQLDSLLAQKNPSPAVCDILDKTIEFLYGLVGE